MKGFRCPRCRSVMGVCRTRKIAPGVVRRTRVCRACGHRVRTEERLHSTVAVPPGH